MTPQTAHATHGCRRTCDFCPVAVRCPRYVKRPVAGVVDEIRRLPGRYFVFNDVSLTDDPEYARWVKRSNTTAMEFVRPTPEMRW